MPDHAAVDDPVIQARLDLAIRRHTAADWGAVYPEAMVWWAAHAVQTTPGTGVGNDSAEVTGAVISQRDGDLSRTYATPTGSGSTGGGALNMGSTYYGQLYLDLKNSRAVNAPFFAGAWP